MVIEVKGQEPFHIGQGLVMVAALVSCEADGAQLMRLQSDDYQVWALRKLIGIGLRSRRSGKNVNYYFVKFGQSDIDLDLV